MTPLVVTNAVKTIIMIIGVFAILRFLKTAFATKHAAASIKAFDEKKKQAERERKEALKNEGKITIQKSGQISGNVEDVDFDEVK
jgi:type I restriction-modification system DNA methylase subunit